MLVGATAISLVAFVAFAFPIPEALAVAPQRTFVASYGADTNACSLAAPCRGFQAAINAVATGGEVVVLDTAGYGAMEIHKSVSIVVPPGVHAGLSPSTGIPLPGYPGQFGVVFIDIQDTDVVVLRGLNINQQGTVTGGIEWISVHGGTVQVENAVVNGFSKEAIYVQAPASTLIVKDSVLRNSGVGLYGAVTGGGRGFIQAGGIFADHVRIENMTTAVRALTEVGMVLSNSEITSNTLAFDMQANGTYSSTVRIDRCSIIRNGTIFTLFGAGGGPAGQPYAAWEAAASILNYNGPGSRSGSTHVYSYGNNSVDFAVLFDSIFPPQ
jgi:hypothetical protein